MTSSNTSTTMPESQSDETELPAETHHTTSSQSNEIHSGVGVLDKTVKILDALESGPATLGQLVSSTGLARPKCKMYAMSDCGKADILIFTQLWKKLEKI